MKLSLLIAALALFLSLPIAAQDKGVWRAASSAANAITGDIEIKDAKISFNYTPFALAQMRSLTPAELSAVFDADRSSNPVGNLYRVNIPASVRFLHHNTLCGTEDTEWMATYADGKTLQVAFFSGTDAPALTFEAITNSTALCGTFTYTR
jgi:hypothetical protein